LEVIRIDDKRSRYVTDERTIRSTRERVNLGRNLPPRLPLPVVTLYPSLREGRMFMASMKELLSRPGDVARLTGFFLEVTVKEPNKFDRERAEKENKAAKTKHEFRFQPNGLAERKVKFDAEVFPISQLMPLEGALVVIEVEGFDWKLDDGKTGTSYRLIKVAQILLDANGGEPQRKTA
jgi:hypothetical protein